MALRAVLALLIGLSAAGTPSLAREDDTGLAPPTEQELAAVCPDETAACLAHPACAPHIGAAQPPDKPPPGFLELILCFQRSGVGMARRGELREERRANTEVAGEIKCEACTLVVEDLYSMLLHRPATETDHHSTEDTL